MQKKEVPNGLKNGISIHNQVCVRLTWLTSSRASGASATARMNKTQLGVETNRNQRIPESLKPKLYTPYSFHQESYFHQVLKDATMSV